MQASPLQPDMMALFSVVIFILIFKKAFSIRVNCKEDVFRNNLVLVILEKMFLYSLRGLENSYTLK